MSTQCAICLCGYTEPASIPCGHVYCLKCISDYISSSSPDGFTASCPSCRTEFPIVLPELHSLPNKFHRYVTPSIRRVFIEPETFKQRLDALEARITVLERDNGVLVAAVAKEKNDMQKMKPLETERKKTCVCDDTRSKTPPSMCMQSGNDAYLRLQLRIFLQILVGKPCSRRPLCQRCDLNPFRHSLL